MAMWKLPLLFLVGLSFLAVSATARPCHTLFFITSYYPSNPSLTFFFTTPPLRGDHIKFRFNKPSIFFEDELVERKEEEDVSKRSMFPVEFHSSVKSSIRDRTNDIMRVMGAMLFGAGCGALTAAIMYLIWSLFWPTTFDFDDSDVTPKNMGYVVLPTKVVDDLKKPAKEVV